MNGTISTAAACIICDKLLDNYEIEFDGSHCNKCRWAYEHVTASRNGGNNRAGNPGIMMRSAGFEPAAFSLGS